MPTDAQPDVNAMERWLGRRFDVQHVFTNWDPDRAVMQTLFEDTLEAIQAAGRTPLLTWEPFTPTPSETSPRIVHRIVDGEHDEYLDRWGEALRSWLNEPSGESRRLYLRLGHEMNGTWYPWGAGSDFVSALDYKRMWRYVFERLLAAGVDRARLERIWCVNHVDVGNVTAEACYPGDEYVDWVAVDGYNWGATAEWSTWRPPRKVFHDMVRRLRSCSNVPIAITEFGSTSLTETGHAPARKATWLEAAFEFFETADVDMVVGFNVDKETDWAVFGGERGTASITIDGQSYFVYPTFFDGLNSYAAEASK